MCDIVSHATSNQYNKAQEILYSITQINSLMYREGNPTGIKGLLEVLGICNSEVRSPLAKASEDLMAEIKSAYIDIK